MYLLCFLSLRIQCPFWLIFRVFYTAILYISPVIFSYCMRKGKSNLYSILARSRSPCYLTVTIGISLVSHKVGHHLFLFLLIFVLAIRIPLLLNCLFIYYFDFSVEFSFSLLFCRNYFYVLDNNVYQLCVI